MPRSQLDVPPAVPLDFVLRHARLLRQRNPINADANTALQLHELLEHYPGKLRITDAKERFLQIRNEL
jgi:hypothetical protein